jgi:hypothetical protein
MDNKIKKKEFEQLFGNDLLLLLIHSKNTSWELPENIMEAFIVEKGFDCHLSKPEKEYLIEFIKKAQTGNYTTVEAILVELF